MVNKKTALSLISDNLLAQAAQDTQANIFKKKHDAGTLLKLLLFSHITTDSVSLRSLSDDYSSPFFVALLRNTSLHAGTIGKSTIADFLSQAPSDFFKNIFSELVQKYRKVLFRKSKDNVVRFDSTFTSLSKKLLLCGTQAQKRSKKRQVKATVAYRDIPEAVELYFEKNQSDEPSLKAAVLNHSYKPGDIAVFDRGMQSRKSFIEIDQKGISFVSRLHSKPNYKVVEAHDVQENKSGKLTILSDSRAKLRSHGVHWHSHDFRVIETVNGEGKKYYFVSNCLDISAGAICEIYKSRWEIEIFFKYLKSYLNGRHFLSRSENGIKNVYYIRLIAAILVTLIAKMCDLTGFKAAKRLIRSMLQAYVAGWPAGLTFGQGPPITTYLIQTWKKKSIHV